MVTITMKNRALTHEFNCFLTISAKKVHFLSITIDKSNKNDKT